MTDSIFTLKNNAGTNFLNMEWKLLLFITYTYLLL